MKNVLLIGDLRCAMNFGAVATSEALLRLFEKIDNIELKCIDSRSYFKMTPDNGYSLSVEDFMEDKRKKALESVEKSKTVIKRCDDKEWRKRYISPIKYSEYKTFASEVIEGKKFLYERKLLEWADIVIINGEGNLVHGTDRYGTYRMGGCYILFMAYLSRITFDKPTYMINHTVDPDNMDAEEMIKNIYPDLDGIFVREKYSLNKLNEWNISNVRLVPDALFSYDFGQIGVGDADIFKEIDYNEPYICIGDSSGIKNNFGNINWDVEWYYDNFIEEIKKDYKQIVFVDGFGGKNKNINNIIEKHGLASVNIYKNSFQELYKVLEGAQIFISGRWHASIMSLKAHTPVLCYGADSHKTAGLYGLIDYPFKFFDIKSLPVNIDEMLQEINKIVDYDMTEIWKKVDELSAKSYDNLKMLK